MFVFSQKEDNPTNVMLLAAFVGLLSVVSLKPEIHTACVTTVMHPLCYSLECSSPSALLFICNAVLDVGERM